jgi:hypothetical protein
LAAVEGRKSHCRQPAQKRTRQTLVDRTGLWEYVVSIRNPAKKRTDTEGREKNDSERFAKGFARKMN